METYWDLTEAARQAWEEEDFPRAFDLLLPLAEKGNAAAQFIVGTMYDLGLGMLENSPEAVRWYIRAANQGHGIACNNLETIYLAGRPGVAADPDQAAQYRKMARQSGFDVRDYLKVDEDG